MDGVINNRTITVSKSWPRPIVVRYQQQVVVSADRQQQNDGQRQHNPEQGHAKLFRARPMLREITPEYLEHKID
jgi:hypothetical protein